jgi:hypothetical protein
MQGALKDAGADDGGEHKSKNESREMPQTNVHSYSPGVSSKNILPGGGTPVANRVPELSNFGNTQISLRVGRLKEKWVQEDRRHSRIQILHTERNIAREGA